MLRLWPVPFLALLAACPLALPTISDGYPCASDSDCLRGYACLEGSCRVEDIDGVDAAVTDRPDANALLDGGPSDGGDAGGPLPLPDAGPVPCAGENDEDADGINDGCDVCPARADPGQEDSDGDGVGDACDPRPQTAGDTLVFFDGFGSGALDEAYRTRGGGEWSVVGGRLLQSDAAVEARLWLPGTGGADVIVETAVRLDAVTFLSRGSAGPMARADGESAIVCGLGRHEAPDVSGVLDVYVIEWLTGTVASTVTGAPAEVPDTGVVYPFTLDVRDVDIRCATATDDITGILTEVTNGAAGLRTANAKAAFEYLQVIRRGP